MDPTNFDEQDAGGLDRRTVLRRGAVLGGALVWTVPAVQSIAGPAFAAGTPCTPVAILGIDRSNPPDGDFNDPNDTCVGTFSFVGDDCCTCFTNNGSNAAALALCVGNGSCTEQYSPGVC